MRLLVNKDTLKMGEELIRKAYHGKDIYDLWASRHGAQAERARAMLHPIPEAPVVEREAFVLERCAGRRVLHVGCNGTDGKGAFHEEIRKVAESLYGLDREGAADFIMDLDAIPSPYDELPLFNLVDKLDLIVCGEVLEHLANPGVFLATVRELWAPVLITVPNAFSHVAARWNLQGRECVNPDHVCWYSYHTLKVLVERYGYTVAEWYWYNGEPRTAEGLVFVVRPDA